MIDASTSADAAVGRDAPAGSLLPPDVVPGRAFPFLTLVIAFLAAVSCATALAAARLAQAWEPGGKQVATLQVVASADEIETQARAALDVLRATDGVASVRVIEIEEQMALLEPWLGPQVAADKLPLPLLIEVEVLPYVLDQELLIATLAEQAPGAALDTGIAWRGRLAAIARGLSWFAAIGLGMFVIAQAALSALVGRAMVAEFGSAAATLRSVGATDGFIAGALFRRLRRPALVACCLGAALASAFLWILPEDAEGVFLASITPASSAEWLAVIAAPCLVFVAHWLGARNAVGRRLRRWS